MGQYYTPIIKRGETFKTFYSHDYGEGLKLMEHSYQGNWFVSTVLNQLVNNPGELAWVGDYAKLEDVEPTKQSLAKEFINMQNKKYSKPKVVKKLKEEIFINHSKKEYFILSQTPIKEDEDGFKIHPLPLLTAIGNGKGGGDYRGVNDSLVGKWALDLIEIVDSLDEKTSKYTDISKIIYFGKK